MLQENLLIAYANSFRDNWELPALTDYLTGQTLTYGDLSRRIAKFHQFYRSIGIKQGDKIALVGKNNMNWVTVFMSTITYGAVIVPVLQEFNSQDARHIINHSDSVLLFISDNLWESYELDDIPRVRAAISINDMSLIAERDNPERPSIIEKTLRNVNRRFRKNYPDGFTQADIKYPHYRNRPVCPDGGRSSKRHGRFIQDPRASLSENERRSVQTRRLDPGRKTHAGKDHFSR
ncbi:MAG: AMP-binding protein [Muribaculaceae bacterium]|nr:AMP-binding protein [Muribaculaceae bacterium]